MLDKVIAALEAKKQQQSEAGARFVREQCILDELAPREWSKFRLTLKSDCEKRPQYFEFRGVMANSASVWCRSNRRVLEVEYLPASKTIAHRIVSKTADDLIGSCSIGLDENSLPAIFDVDGRVFPSTAYAVEELLTLLLS